MLFLDNDLLLTLYTNNKSKEIAIDICLLATFLVVCSILCEAYIWL